MKYTILVIALVLATLVIAAPALAAAPPTPPQLQVPDGYSVHLEEFSDWVNVVMVMPASSTDEQDMPFRMIVFRKVRDIGKDVLITECYGDPGSAVKKCDPLIYIDIEDFIALPLPWSEDTTPMTGASKA